jgi:hypothetical protein
MTAACTGLVDGGESTTSIEGSTTSQPEPTLPPVIDCPGIGDFGEGGVLAEIEATDSDSNTLGRISWEQSDQCETFRFEFETSEGAPATTVPDIEIAHLESFQVIRVRMDIQATVVTDQLVETGLVDRLYVVRALDGGMFVDLHLAEPAAVRALGQSSPATLIVDLRPGFVPFAGESVIGERVVVVSPGGETAVGQFTQVVGYSRTFEANVVIMVTQGGAIISETDTTAADYIDTWGEFRSQLSLPLGDVSVFVGESSPEDGSLEGVTLVLLVS